MRSLSLKGILSAAVLLLMANPAIAIESSLNPTTDGDIQRFGGLDIDTTRDRINITQSGGLIRNGILEFDLSSIPDGSAINSLSLDVILTAFTSNIGDTANIDIFAFVGDGSITDPDFDAAGTQVFDSTIGAGGTFGGAAGDLISFSLSDEAFFETLLPGDLLTLRIETDNFVIFRFASLENTLFDAATLNINFESADPVPAPAFVSLFAGGLGLMGLFGWRRKRVDAVKG